MLKTCLPNNESHSNLIWKAVNSVTQLECVLLPLDQFLFIYILIKSSPLLLENNCVYCYTDPYLILCSSIRGKQNTSLYSHSLVILLI